MWGFGVLLWEMYAAGAVPYAGLSNKVRIAISVAKLWHVAANASKA